VRLTARRCTRTVALFLTVLAIVAAPISLGCKKDNPAKPCGEVTVYVTDTGTKYHKAGCSYLNHSSTAISLCEAKSRGLGPCSRCKPPE
jgi:hypothetical protein